MSSIWRLNGGDIYVGDYRGKISPTIAELNPINSTSSVYHYINTPDEEVSIEGIVIGSGHLTTIEAGVGGNVTLITDLEPSGITVLFISIEKRREPTTCQLIDDTLPTTAPVYTVTAVLRL